MAKVAKKTWPWPGLPGFTRPHFPGKLGQKPGKGGLARLCQAGRVFDRAPDAREEARSLEEASVAVVVAKYTGNIPSH